MDVLPTFWTFQTPVTAAKDVLFFKPYFGPSQSRSFGDGSPMHNWELGNDDMEHELYLQIKAFWDDHYPGVAFYMYDPQVDETRVYEVDSDYGFHYNHGDSYACSFRIKEVYPYAVTPGIPPPPATPVATAATGVTNNGMTAHWNVSSGADGYRLDVSTSNVFATFVSGYANLDVGKVLLKAITGLSPSTTYYYRVRAYHSVGTSANSNVITQATTA